MVSPGSDSRRSPTYISALEDADKGDLSNLINLFAKRFQASIVAISTSAKLINRQDVCSTGK